MHLTMRAGVALRGRRASSLRSMVNSAPRVQRGASGSDSQWSVRVETAVNPRRGGGPTLLGRQHLLRAPPVRGAGVQPQHSAPSADTRPTAASRHASHVALATLRRLFSARRHALHVAWVVISPAGEMVKLRHPQLHATRVSRAASAMPKVRAAALSREKDASLLRQVRALQRFAQSGIFVPVRRAPHHKYVVSGRTLQ